MIVIIMAGGLGKRMNTELPKVLNQVIVKENPSISYPMLIHVILTASKLNPKRIFIVVGKFIDIICQTIQEYVDNKILTNPELFEFIKQEPALGTGHAILCTLPRIQNYLNSNALILSGDVPLISYDTLINLCGQTNKILITKLSDPFGCGRILFNGNFIIGIVEEKDCNTEQKLIQYVNCGIYQIAVKDLIDLIPQISNSNKSNEYYLTDIIELMVKNNIPIDKFELEKDSQFQIKNVNTKKDLEELNKFIRENII